MYDPAKRLGDDEEAPKKKPALAIMVGFDPKKRIGDDETDGESPEDAGGEPDRLMDEAASGLCKTLARYFNVSPMAAEKAAPAVRQYLESFFHAADSKPHAEGEHPGENETQAEDSKEE